MENKEMRLSLPSDILLAEIVITLRAGFGMKSAVFNTQTGMLVIPIDPKKDKEAEEITKAEHEAQVKAEAHAEELRIEAIKKTTKASKRPKTETEKPKA